MLIKLWLEVSPDEQRKRFEARVRDPLRQWKLSPMDLPSLERWYDYSKARDRMLKETDTRTSPWYILRSDDKEEARLNAIAHVLSMVPYKKLKPEKVTLPDRLTKGQLRRSGYHQAATIRERALLTPEPQHAREPATRD